MNSFKGIVRENEREKVKKCLDESNTEKGVFKESRKGEGKKPFHEPEYLKLLS